MYPKNTEQCLPVVKAPGGSGYISINPEELVIQPRFNLTFHFSEGLAAVMIGRQRGYVENRKNRYRALNADSSS